MKKMMSIAVVALMMTGAAAFACDTCGCQAKKTDEKKAQCTACTKEEKAKCDKCTPEKKCEACTAKAGECTKKAAEEKKSESAE